MACAFGWTRHKPYEHGAFNHLYGAGTVLRALRAGGVDAISKEDVDAFGKCATAMVRRLGEHADIGQIVGDREFLSTARMLQTVAPTAFPAGLCALVLYLRWQEQFHRAGACMDTRSLSDDVRKLGALVDRTELVAALWLLGFYAGYERVAPLAYAANRQRYTWFQGEALEVSHLPVDSGADGVNQPEVRAQSSDASGVAGADASESEANAADAGLRARAADESTTAVHADDTGADRKEEPARGVEASEPSAADDRVGTPDTDSDGFDSTQARGPHSDLFNDETAAGAATDSPVPACDQNTETYGAVPWIKHRDDAGAIQAALAHARREDPNLTRAQLHSHVARHWFGYKQPSAKFLERVKNIDTDVDSNG